MFKVFAVTALFVSASAFAHVEIGSYAGTRADGSVCSIEIQGIEFNGGVKHPINERIRVKADDRVFLLAHPYSETENALGVDHAYLTGALGGRPASAVANLYISHEADSEGPTEFEARVYQTLAGVSTRTIEKCSGLKFQGAALK